MTEKTQSTYLNNRSVLITGCSSGIGRATAVYLAQKGCAVFATVRKEEDAKGLIKLEIPNLIPVYPLDLTNLEQISRIEEIVTKELAFRKLEGLFAIINNAGGGNITPIELMDIEKYRIELSARILGPVALLQTFLPLIRKMRGRVLWIVTPALLPIPYVASIHSCDFAVNCIARTLRYELAGTNVRSIMIRCGGIKTEASEKNTRELEDSLKKWPQERLEYYRKALNKEQRDFNKFDEKRTEAEEVAKVIYKALMAAKPKHKYRVGYMSGLAAVLEYLPQSFVDILMSKRVDY